MSTASDGADFIVIGAGMAGASVAAAVSAHAKVILLEAESAPGYHATGRSAAFYAETYGGPDVQPLTTASKDFLTAPPAWAADVTANGSFLGQRGALHIANAQSQVRVAQMVGAYPTALRLEAVGPAEIAKRAPMLRPAWQVAAVWEPQCADIDVAALHQAYLRETKRRGGLVVADAPVMALARYGGGWQVTAGAQTYHAPVVVNAAGAWGDVIAALAGVQPIGLQALRRTILTFAPGDGLYDPAAPLIVDISGTFYFKPDSGMIWASPHDETPDQPGDAQPEELDIALTVDRIEQATTYQVRRIARSWAGLRTFAPDRAPVFGFEPSAPGFFWCVGQGGFGIQTAPAAADLCAALLLDKPLADALHHQGITRHRYGPQRLRT